MMLNNEMQYKSTVDIAPKKEMKSNGTHSVNTFHQETTFHKSNHNSSRHINSQIIDKIKTIVQEKYNIHFSNSDEDKNLVKTKHEIHQQSESENKPVGSKMKSKTQTVISKIKELPIYNYFPKVTPRKGSDISYANQMALLNCHNQSKCIIPELQLQKTFKIYFCKHPTRQGVRFYYLLKEGLHLHPGVELVSYEEIDQADFIIYLPGSAPWHLTECTNASYANRLIVLDEFDGSTLFAPMSVADYEKVYGSLNNLWYFMYYKRSFVGRRDGRFLGYIHMDKPHVYPITYAIAELYVQYQFNYKREIDILCTLRGSKHMTTRLRVQQWVADYGKLRNVPNVISGQINTETRTTVSLGYFQQMYNSQIIVTVNPANWEGDFRLWESMCTGALVMVDHLYVPHNYPMIDGEHIIYFSNENKTDLWNKLDYYRQHPEEARRIAINGYLFAMKYHRTVNIVDYILRSSHQKYAEDHKVVPVPQYTDTAQQIMNSIQLKSDYYQKIVQESKKCLKESEELVKNQMNSIPDESSSSSTGGNNIKFGQ